MRITDVIAQYILEQMEEAGGIAEIQRNELAGSIGCVPSQINYVITSRFTPEKGYMTESRRGGGGFIRIIRVKMTKNEYLMHFFHAIGDSVDEREARAYVKNLFDHGILSEREAGIVVQAVSEAALGKCPAEIRNGVRADVLRRIIMMLLM